MTLRLDLNRPEVVDYISRFGSRCRGCADEDGVCQSSGLPCADQRKAIKHVLYALEYGVKHNFITIRAAAPREEQYDRVLLLVWNTLRGSFTREGCKRLTSAIMTELAPMALDTVRNRLDHILRGVRNGSQTNEEAIDAILQITARVSPEPEPAPPPARTGANVADDIHNGRWPERPTGPTLAEVIQNSVRATNGVGMTTAHAERIAERIIAGHAYSWDEK